MDYIYSLILFYKKQKNKEKEKAEVIVETEVVHKKAQRIRNGAKKNYSHLKPDSELLSLVVFGTYKDEYGDRIWQFNMKRANRPEDPISQWKILCGLPVTPMIPFHSLLVTHGDFIYIIGGRQQTLDVSYPFWSLDFWFLKNIPVQVTAACYRYDPPQKRIDRIADLNFERMDHSVVIVKDTIYAVGGIDKDGQ